MTTKKPNQNDRCKGNTIALLGILLQGVGCITAIVYSRDKEITATLGPLAGVALGGLIQYVNNRSGESQKK